MHTPATFYRNRLPHLTPVGGTFFVTFRIHDALPLRLMQRLKFDYELEVSRIVKQDMSHLRREQLIHKAQYRYFTTYDSHLDQTSYDDGCYLNDPKACQLLQDELHRHDGTLYDLKAYCVMPNHVHLLIATGIQTADQNHCLYDEETLRGKYIPLFEIMRKIKGVSAREINRYLGRKGKLWQKDSYDHFVRSAKAYDNIVDYILNNPVSAGLVSSFREYEFLYFK